MAPETAVNSGVGGWSYVRALEDGEPDAIELQLREDNIRKHIYPYGWKEDVYIPLQIRSSVTHICALSVHVHEKDGQRSKEYFITVQTNSPWEVTAHFQLTRQQAKQIFALQPPQILEEIKRIRTQANRQEANS